jgi:hypothetical protein
MSAGWGIDVTFFLGAPLNDKQLDILSDRFDELDWTVAQQPEGFLSVSGNADDGESLEPACWIVVEISKQSLLDIGFDGAELVRIAIFSERWREVEVLAPSLPELLATTDIGKVLNVSRQRVWQLHKDHPKFPAPVVCTGAGPLWTRSAVDWFASVWDRRPGRRTDHPDEAGDRPVVTELKPHPRVGSRGARTGSKAPQEWVEA